MSFSATCTTRVKATNELPHTHPMPAHRHPPSLSHVRADNIHKYFYNPSPHTATMDEIAPEYDVVVVGTGGFQSTPPDPL